MRRAPLIAVVGICAVGKSTLVQQLRHRGYAAVEVAQEHSEIPYLWARHSPDLLVHLDARDEIVAARRSYLHSERLRIERQLLSYAKRKADLTIDVSDMEESEVLCRVLEALTNETADLDPGS